MRKGSRRDAFRIAWRGVASALLKSAMNSSAAGSERRHLLELRLAEVVVALRKDHGEGNLTLRVPETGDFIAILQISDDEARGLADLLGRP